MSKTFVWCLYSVAYENDSYFDNAISSVFKDKPSVEQVIKTLDVSKEVALDVLESSSSSDDYGFYYIQKVELQ